MPDDRIPVQGSPWPQDIRTHDGCNYKQDAGGFFYVRPEHLDELCNNRENGLTRPGPTPADPTAPNPSVPAELPPNPPGNPPGDENAQP